MKVCAAVFGEKMPFIWVIGGFHFLCPQAHVVFEPSLQMQRKCETCTDSAIDGVFTVIYDVNRESNAGELQVPHRISPLLDLTEVWFLRTQK